MGERSGRVYVDANALIYAIKGGDEISRPVRALLDALVRRSQSFVTSELSLAEVLVGVEGRGSLIHKRMYLDLLDESRLFELVPVTRRVLEEAARYRATVYGPPTGARDDRRNFFPDAIHIVSAAEAGCRFFVSGDTRLRLPDGMRRIEPDQRGVDDVSRWSA